MKLSSLETTPNPHCMKLNLDQPIVDQAITLKSGEDCQDLPKAIAQLIEIDGVKEAFLNNDFVA
ncbi:MAG: NifU N-terminal domain-containing protein, partial [Halothece sp. Uz-M2-17]|nr:NifU N-terminal domain-containing protein [Halothece sp. Uz-M2-17]